MSAAVWTARGNAGDTRVAYGAGEVVPAKHDPVRRDDRLNIGGWHTANDLADKLILVTWA